MATFPQVICLDRRKMAFLGFYTTFLCLCLLISSTNGRNYCDKSFERCICTDESVVCHNETKLIDNLFNLYPMIKDHVKEITITGSRFEEMPPNFFGSCHLAPDLVLKELEHVDLSSNRIKTIQGKTFRCMPNVKTLILRDNQWQIDRNEHQIGYFTSLTNLKKLDLTDTFEDVWDGTIHVSKLSKIFYETDMTSLEDLHLGYNEFNSLSVSGANSLCELYSLKILNLTHNNFSEPSMPTKRNCFPKLEILDLSWNKIESLTNEFMDEIEAINNKFRTLTIVQLDNNPFRCDCWLKDTWHWLNSTKVPVNKHMLKCKSGYHSSYTGKLILDLTPDDLLCDTTEMVQPSHVVDNVSVKVVVAIIAVLIGIILTAFIVICRVKIGRWTGIVKNKVPYVNLKPDQGNSSKQTVYVIKI